jgi:DNA polymerase II small subunit/DNA polymerase delta subunit B
MNLISNPDSVDQDQCRDILILLGQDLDDFLAEMIIKRYHFYSLTPKEAKLIVKNYIFQMNE